MYFNHKSDGLKYPACIYSLRMRISIFLVAFGALGGVFTLPARLPKRENVVMSEGKLLEDFHNIRLKKALEAIPYHSMTGPRFQGIPRFLRKNATHPHPLRSKGVVGTNKKERFVDYGDLTLGKEKVTAKDVSASLYFPSHKESVKVFKGLRDFAPTYKLKMKILQPKVEEKTLQDHLRELEKWTQQKRIAMGMESKRTGYKEYLQWKKDRMKKQATSSSSTTPPPKPDDYIDDAVDCINNDCDM